MPSRICLVRHGHTKLNRGGASAERIRGWRDIPLDEEGRREARRIAGEFAGKPVNAIYSSPLNRAMDTAIAIGQQTDVSPEADVCLMPWNLGTMQGQTVDDVMPIMNQYVKQEDEAPPGGEPFSAFRKRFLAFLLRKIGDCASCSPEDIMVLVTHSRDVQLTKAWVAGGSKEDKTIDVQAMLDYSEEIHPGGHLWLKVGAK